MIFRQVKIFKLLKNNKLMLFGKSTLKQLILLKLELKLELNIRFLSKNTFLITIFLNNCFLLILNWIFFIFYKIKKLLKKLLDKANSKLNLMKKLFK